MIKIENEIYRKTILFLYGTSVLHLKGDLNTRREVFLKCSETHYITLRSIKSLHEIVFAIRTHETQLVSNRDIESKVHI